MKTLAIFVSLCASTLAASSPARADDDGLPPIPPAMDPAGAVNPISVVSGAGVRVGDGTVLRPQFGIETGVVSNVFYEKNGPDTAGVLRILAQIGTGSLTGQRLARRSSGDDQNTDTPQETTATTNGDFQYSADLYAAYEQYLSSNSDVTAQGGVSGGMLLRGIVNPQHTLQFAFQEHFDRVIRATNYESNVDTNRDINQLALRINVMPYGRSLNGNLYYVNTIDVFEASEQQFANRLQNTAGLHLNWRWLPLTQLYADVSASYYSGIGNSDKVNSYPVTGVLGIQTALTINTTLNAHAGYTNGFYASGPSYSTLSAGAMLGYRYSPLGRVTAMYSYDHEDSINANFFRDHLFRLTFEQYVIPFVLFVQPELRLRQYDGTIVMDTTGSTTRNDTIVGITAGARYNFRDWIAATLDYQLQYVHTDFQYQASETVVLNPSYTRHELLLGIRAAY
jgi:hypothetical protein